MILNRIWVILWKLSVVSYNLLLLKRTILTKNTTSFANYKQNAHIFARNNIFLSRGDNKKARGNLIFHGAKSSPRGNLQENHAKIGLSDLLMHGTSENNKHIKTINSHRFA